MRDKATTTITMIIINTTTPPALAPAMIETDAADEDDSDDAVAANADPEVTVYIPRQLTPYTVASTEIWLLEIENDENDVSLVQSPVAPPPSEIHETVSQAQPFWLLDTNVAYCAAEPEAP